MITFKQEEQKILFEQTDKESFILDVHCLLNRQVKEKERYKENHKLMKPWENVFCSITDSLTTQISCILNGIWNQQLILNHNYS